jgi:tetratricopeptide (TPR) repeat protein
MKSIFIVFFLLLGIGGFQKIAEVNEHSEKAAAAFRKSNFKEAIKNYEFLVYEIGDKDPRILLNLAHAYRLNNQAEKATKAYQKCVKSPDANLRSVAWENLATLETKIQNYSEALTNFKRALVANPKNEQARYNYELLKKYLREHPDDQNKIPPPQPEKKEKQDEQKKQPQDQEKT